MVGGYCFVGWRGLCIVGGRVFGRVDWFFVFVCDEWWWWGIYLGYDLDFFEGNIWDDLVGGNKFVGLICGRVL